MSRPTATNPSPVTEHAYDHVRCRSAKGPTVPALITGQSDGGVCVAKNSRATRLLRWADTLLLTIPNQLGVDYNAHVLESILKYVAPELGWR